MIVYEKHKQRLENYENISKILNCEKFSAIDSENDYDKYREFALKNNYTTQHYLNKTKAYPVKLGCNCF